MKTFTTSLIISLSILLSSFVSIDGLAAPLLPASPNSRGAAFFTDGFSVKGETVVNTGETVILSPVDAAGCSITWTPIQGIELISKMVQTNEAKDVVNDDLEFIGLPVSSLLFKASSPGVIRFQCTAIDWDNRKFFQVIHSVSVAGSSDNGEQVEPPTPSVKFSKTDYLVLIEESSNRTVEAAKIVNSEWWQLGLVRDGFNKPLIKDKDGSGGDFVTAAVASGGYAEVPFLAIMDKEGNLVSTFAMPDSVEDLKKELGL